MDDVTPPPIRRIVVDEAPTVAQPPVVTPGAEPANGHAGGAAVSLPAHGAGPAPTAQPLRQREPRPLGRERMRTDELSVSYADKPAVSGVTLPVRQGEVLGLIGPSGCGKTTLLRSLNRLTELTPSARRGGRIALDGDDIDAIEVTSLRRRVSMVFQQPNPFPMSVFDNVAYALRQQGSRRPRRGELGPAVIEALQRAGLYDEVADDLDHPALRLSGGQQQRLCIARALAAQPEVLLLDEPCSALDPRSTATIEELIVGLRAEVAVVIVTHNLQQAWRIADYVGFMYLGELVEYGPVDQVFGAPHAERTREYVSGAFG
jgi:phosphate transport system ATP-binding protein